jgi:steroid delta-isomerase-like uncharacterized protein
VSDTLEVVERYVAALNAHDVDGVLDCVTDDYTSEHVATLGSGLRGKRAYRERLPAFLAEFDDLHYEIEDTIVDGDRAAVAYRMSCRWRGETGAARSVALRGLFRFRIEEGRVAQRVDYWDSGDFQRQVDGTG